MKSLALKKLYKEIGQSVHSMNMLAIGLELLPANDLQVPKGLRITWHSNDISYSKKIARSFAERSAMVYAVESFFEYLINISRDPLWQYPNINFEGDDKKADKVSKFLSQIPEVDDYLIVLSEFLCHWRNKIIHINSKSHLTKRKIDLLLRKEQYIYDNIHHFSTEKALANFENRTITLKDSSTLITVALKCAEKIDKHYLKGISEIDDIAQITSFFMDYRDFRRAYNQTDNPLRRKRQLISWLNTNYPYFRGKKQDLIINHSLQS